MLIQYTVFYVDLFITLQDFWSAFDLCVTALYQGYESDELLDQYFYLRSVINGKD